MIKIHSYVSFTDPFILRNCAAKSPSIGTIRVSCDSSHQILVTLSYTNNCSISIMTINGSSPLTMTGLDPGVMYIVAISLFDRNQVILRNLTVIKSIKVMSGKNIHLHVYVHKIIHIYV